MRLLFAFTKVIVFTEIKAKLPKVRNNLLEQINLQWDHIVSTNTCFQRILMGNRKANKFLISKEYGRHEVLKAHSQF